MLARYLSFIGPPGSGKTSQIQLLEGVLKPHNFLVASVPRLVRRQADLVALLTEGERRELDALTDAAHQARDRGELAPIELDKLLFKSLQRVGGEIVVALDGCPRGVRQARLFLEKGELSASAGIILFYFPENERTWSLNRQYSRECVKRGESSARARQHIFQRKFEVYMRDTLPGVTLLARTGVPIIRLAATMDAQLIHERVVTAVKQNFSTSTIDRESQ